MSLCSVRIGAPKVRLKFKKLNFSFTDLAAQYYNLAFVKEIDRNNLVYSTLKPVDLILANTGAHPSKNYHSNEFNSNKQTSNSTRSALNKSTLFSDRISNRIEMRENVFEKILLN